VQVYIAPNPLLFKGRGRERRWECGRGGRSREKVRVGKGEGEEERGGDYHSHWRHDNLAVLRDFYVGCFRVTVPCTSLLSQWFLC